MLYKQFSKQLFIVKFQLVFTILYNKYFVVHIIWIAFIKFQLLFINLICAE